MTQAEMLVRSLKEILDPMVKNNVIKGYSYQENPNDPNNVIVSIRIHPVPFIQVIL